MRLLLTDNNEEYLGPTCYPLLLSSKGQPLYTEQVGIRHPIGTFNIAIDPVKKHFSNTLDHLSSISNKTEPPDHDFQNLLDSHQHLLYSVMEYFEAIGKSALCFFPKDEATKNKAHKEFTNALKAPRAHAAKIVNAIKHNQNRLCPIHSRSKYFGAYGYYVAAPLSHNSIGPNTDVHKEYRGLSTAFSFNKDLRRLFVNIYEAS